jgi:NAD(P)-dependent dehydrogenase (short-subunit alcohol dehydrogenase family)
MAKIFITGSADGIGKLAGLRLLSEGHDVVFHARNESRAADLRPSVKNSSIVVGDLSSIEGMRAVAEAANLLGAFDTVIHNAAVGYQERLRKVTVDSVAHVFAVNSLAPYVLTSLIHPPKRLIYISSGLHRSGDSSLEDLNWEKKPWSGYAAYSDSKLHNVLLAFAAARKWPRTFSNAIDPGWVPTKMGGPAAPDNLEKGAETQAWLAVSDDREAQVSGRFFFHKRLHDHHPEASRADLQEQFLAECERLSGVRFPSVS